MNNKHLGYIAAGFFAGLATSYLSSYFGKPKKAITKTVIKKKEHVKEELEEIKLTKDQKMKDFKKVWEEHLAKAIIDDIYEEIPQRSRDYILRLINYTVPGGKLNRGLQVVDTLLIMRKGRVSQELLFKARVLGWCIELLQAYFLVEDDIMDQSETRRGEKCWYKLPEVGLDAINDGMIMLSIIFRLISKYFGDDAHYREIVDLFNEVTYQTELGQHLDLTSQPKPKVSIDLSLYTLELYKLIVKYKTAFYSFYLPVALGAIASDMSDNGHSIISNNLLQSPQFRLVREICLDMGEYFQIQDDYLDCYGSPEEIGKIGRDIEEAKCCWLVIQALERATPEQATIIRENYGRDDPELVAKVKQVYKEIDIPNVYRNYEISTAQKIKDKIQQLDSDLVPKEVCTSLLQKIEGRSK